jgi:hypothetical protein
MPYKVGYWVDLTSVKFNEGDTPATWIQAMTVGTYEHPVYGTIDITPERIQKFAANVNSRARGTDLDIDYDHKDKTGEAAGWIKQADARDNGLWVLVEWTKQAAQKIKDKAYRYFSPEFVDEWTHPQSQQTFQDVLLGGGITNRPFLKDIQPINMSELFAGEHQKQPEGGTGMDPKKLRELLGLQESATDADVEAAVKKFKETPTPPSGGGNPDPQLIKLAEDNPVIKQLLENQKTMATQLAETQAALQLSEVSGVVTKLNEGKQHQLPAVVLNELPAALVQMPKALRESVVGIITKLTDTGLVNTKEVGGKGPNGGNETNIDGVKAFTEKVAAVMKDNDKLDYGSAVNHVALTEPALWDAYRKASYAVQD